MKKPGKTISAFLLTLITASIASCSLAEESQNIEKPQSENNRDGYYLSIGAGYINLESPTFEKTDGVRVVFNGRYQWKGFFAEAAIDASRDKNLPALGYNFYNTDHWSLDAIFAVTGSDLRFKYNYYGEAKQISAQPPRGVGLRAQGSWGNTFVQAIALPYYHEEFRTDSAIEYASLWAGHRWQIKNWSLSGLVGAQYQSSGLLDHQWGVTENEADEFISAYQPSSGIDYTAQIDLTYPVTKNVLFQMYSRHMLYSDETLDSPMVKKIREYHKHPEQEREFGILLNYVF
ncbi:MipA/OmpV family protein [Cellvibrio sp. pealriver]|uniref:MipA/OmpV family protein n=1 Tax=Cellvibrio sp. pealriver TaxID=1622269 RepID=UPI00066FBA44|nr:MipA/OmpV family protein [Cellvibrio sp. pealriver]